MQPAEQKKRSPWLYVGIGCGVLLLLGVGAVAAGGLFLVKKGQQFQQDMANRPGQNRLRMALWLAPDPAPGKPLEQLELKSTPVDPETMRTFMSHINPCQES